MGRRWACLSVVAAAIACGDGGGGPSPVSDGGEDPCVGVTQCSAEGRGCDGDTLVTCATNAAGCLVESRDDCAARGEACDDAGGVAACADSCAGVSDCSAEGRSCEADELVVCAPDAQGCLVETRTDCTTMPTEGFCDDSGAAAMCAGPPDPCDGVSDCATEGRVCSGGTLEVCAMDATGCLVLAPTDCTATCEVCDDTGAMPVCNASCTDAPECMGLADGDILCDGRDLVTCSLVDGCLVADRMDCLEAGVQCDDAAPAACVDLCLPRFEVLSCDNQGTPVSGNTAGGTTHFESYQCAGFLSYPAEERIYVFQNPQAARVTVTATFDVASADFDLYALDGTGAACDEMATCLDVSAGLTGTESVTFSALADDLRYVVIDLFGAGTGPFTLDVTCELPTCGDGILGTGEECDTGVLGADDGCSDTCLREPNQECTGEPSTCVYALCGDGMVTGSEACDTGVMGTDDGCTDTCNLERGYVCSGDPSVCSRIPGDLCSDARPLVEGVPEVIDLSNAVDDYRSACSVQGLVAGDVVRTIDVPPGDLLTVEATPLGFDDPTLGIGVSCEEIMANRCLALSNTALSGEVETITYRNVTTGTFTAYVVIDKYYADEGVSVLATLNTPICGNGTIDTGETCDTGAAGVADGCDDFCLVEPGHECTGEPSTCLVLPGDICEFAIAPTSGVVETIDLSSLHDDYGRIYCGVQDGSGDAVFTVDVPDGESVSAELVPNNGRDSLTVALARSCAEIEGDACFMKRDNRMSGATEKIAYYNTTGSTETIYVIADGFQNASSVDVLITVRVPVCGDGIREGQECDTGVLGVDDGCDDNCEVEPGYGCYGDPSTCDPVSDDCTAPVMLTSGVAVSGSTIDAADDFPTGTGCGGTPDRAADTVYSLDVPDGHTLTAVVMAEEPFNPMIAIGRTCGTCFDAVNLRPRSSPETITYTNVTGGAETIYIVIDGFYTVGNYLLTATVTPP